MSEAQKDWIAMFTSVVDEINRSPSFPKLVRIRQDVDRAIESRMMVVEACHSDSNSKHPLHVQLSDVQCPESEREYIDALVALIERVHNISKREYGKPAIAGY
jgi:hypothetical protein